MKILTKERVIEIINISETAEDTIISLFKEVFPDWDKIQKIDEYVPASKTLWLFICDQLIEKFGQSGGLKWMNWGFSVDDTLLDWNVNTNIKISYI